MHFQCSLNASLSAFGGVAVFVKEKFGDGIHIFVKVEICCFFQKYGISHRLDVGFPHSFSPIKMSLFFYCKHTSSHHLRLFVVLPNCFGYLLFASIS